MQNFVDCDTDGFMAAAIRAELLTNTLRTEMCADSVEVRFFDQGRQLAALVHWGDLSHAERVPIEVENAPTSIEVSALVSKLGRWRARTDSDG